MADGGAWRRTTEPGATARVRPPGDVDHPGLVLRAPGTPWRGMRCCRVTTSQPDTDRSAVLGEGPRSWLPPPSRSSTSRNSCTRRRAFSPDHRTPRRFPGCVIGGSDGASVAGSRRSSAARRPALCQRPAPSGPWTALRRPRPPPAAASSSSRRVPSHKSQPAARISRSTTSSAAGPLDHVGQRRMGPQGELRVSRLLLADPLDQAQPKAAAPAVVDSAAHRCTHTSQGEDGERERAASKYHSHSACAIPFVGIVKPFVRRRPGLRPARPRRRLVVVARGRLTSTGAPRRSTSFASLTSASTR